jgi:hypothetical protein
MAVVHCRYGCPPHQQPDDHPDLPDGYVWVCLGALGAEDAPGDRLTPYHGALPLCQCSCGHDPQGSVGSVGYQFDRSD